ncbi:MAG: hypothetical protein R6U96_09230 [Promethearchaeia archaeon]
MSQRKQLQKQIYNITQRAIDNSDKIIVFEQRHLDHILENFQVSSDKLINWDIEDPIKPNVKPEKAFKLIKKQFKIYLPIFELTTLKGDGPCILNVAYENSTFFDSNLIIHFSKYIYDRSFQNSMFFLYNGTDFKLNKSKAIFSSFCLSKHRNLCNT